uniref:BTB domain-containing protein n=1 Tax=Panagrolaimus sp. ES5 TaxID=591445 RepID=A0AC34FG98_9BILA
MNTAAKNVLELQLIKFDLFKTQDPENARFDVIFELDGKLLYAHKSVLNLVSDTFDSMLSERWTSKDEPIKIEDYTFDVFYQFITFLYSGECQPTNKNIFSMIDIAEFYNVKCFKNYCDEFVSKVKFNGKNIFTFLEVADKYSLPQLNAALQKFIANDFDQILNSEAILASKRSVIESIVFSNEVKPEDLFQLVYKWAEKQAMDKGSNTNDAIKSEITSFLPNIQFNYMKLLFLHEFVVPRGFIFESLDELSKILCSRLPENKVKVTNSKGQMLYGNLYPNKYVVDNIKSLKLSINGGITSFCWWEPKFQKPTEPSQIKVNKESELYLVYYPSGRIAVLPPTEVSPGHYLIAEMKAENEFTFTPECKIEAYCDL